MTSTELYVNLHMQSTSTATMAKLGAIVTGAASGVGLELTKHLVSKGWYVVMADINPAGDLISKEFGSQVLWIRTDIANWESQTAMFEEAFSWFPEITFLAANAGINTNMTAAGSIVSTDTVKPQLQVLDVNVLGTIYSIKLFLHKVQERSSAVPKDGSVKARIVITASSAGFYAMPADPIYCISKHALVGLTRSLGPTYLNTYGIAVNAINPGCMPTPFVAPIIALTPANYVTPLSSVMKAYDELLDSKLAGQTVEISGENLYYQKQQAYPNDIARWSVEVPLSFWSAKMRSKS